MIAALETGAPNYRRAARSAHERWSSRSVARAVTPLGHATGPPNTMAGEDSVRPPTQAVLVR